MKSLASVAILLKFFLFVSSEEAPLLRKLQESTPYDVSKLRIATFGVSTTWGAGLANRSSAYPYLLSPNVTNLAIRSCGATYPSICTESLVGDEAIFDVIVLEFVRGDGGLDVLARRLRQRFPGAVILFIFTWNPAALRALTVHGKIVNWMDLISELGYDKELTPESIAGISSHISKYFLNARFPAWLKEQKKVMKEVNGHAIEFGPDEGESKEWFEKKLRIYTDIVHLNEHGHSHVYQRIKETLERLRPKPSNKLGTWGDGDSCHMWFRDGKTDLQHSHNLVMNEFKPARHALEFPSEGGDIIVTNPFASPHKLFISFMATGPESTIYPDVQVTINGDLERKVFIHPLTTDHEHNVHVTKIVPIDFVPSGLNVINIKPMSTTLPPFRLTAIAILGANMDNPDIVAP